VSNRVRATTCANPAQRQLQVALDDALQKLSVRHSSDESIHSVRKDLKKARAALRLLRKGLGEAVYKDENAALRDTGRLLAPLRDAKALAEAFESFRDRFADDLGELRLGGFHRALRKDLSNARHHFHSRAKELVEVRRRVRAHRRRLTRTAVQAIETDVLRPGLKRIYRKARKAGRSAIEEPTADSLHEWRKQVKYLRNALDAVRGLVGKAARKSSRHANRLADALGDDHDLVILALALASRGAASLSLDAERHLQSLIERRRAKLQKRACKLGKKLFAAKPGRFAGDVLAAA
jgi:CHAD domain-containing protein